MPPKVKQMIKEQEEQKIFKEFEELGYTIENIGSILYLRNKEQDVDIKIWIFGKEYSCSIYNRSLVSMITLQEHQLLHKLFEIWGWFDE